MRKLKFQPAIVLLSVCFFSSSSFFVAPQHNSSIQSFDVVRLVCVDVFYRIFIDVNVNRKDKHNE